MNMARELIRSINPQEVHDLYLSLPISSMQDVRVHEQISGPSTESAADLALKPRPARWD